MNGNKEEWTTINNKEEMEQEILWNSQHHFQQAEGSPPTISPLKDILEDGFSDECNQILNGTYLPPANIPKEMEMYIATMKREHPEPTITPTIPVQSIKNGFKKWKENTATSQNIHLGHYKALLAADGKNYNNQTNPSEYIW